MQDLIQLQTGIDSLSENEFWNFIKHIDKHHIAAALFKYFHDKLVKMDKCQEINNKLSSVHKLNELIAEIIRARNNASSPDNNIDNNLIHEISEPDPTKLDDLPVVMLSHISSFLHFEDVLHFEKCNRSIFIATRSPSTLQELDGVYFDLFWKFTIKHKSIYNFHRFASLKRLHLNIYLYDESDDFIPSLNNILISNKLKHLTLTLNAHVLSKSVLDGLALCNLSNLSHFHYDGQINDLLHKSDVNILNKLQNVQYLSLFQLDDDVVDINKLELALSKFSELIGFQIVTDYEPDFEPLLNDIDIRLKSLHWNGYNLNAKHNLMNLQEICLSSPSKRNIDILVNQKLPFFKRIRLNTSGYDYYGITEEHKESIKTLFSIKSLNCIDIETWNDESDTFEIMVKILQKSLNCNQYKTMNINIKCWNRIGIINEDDNDIGNDLFLLFNVLRKRCSNFILSSRFQTKQGNIEYEIDKMLKNTKDAFNDFDVEYENQEIDCYDYVHHEFIINYE